MTVLTEPIETLTTDEKAAIRGYLGATDSTATAAAVSAADALAAYRAKRLRILRLLAASIERVAGKYPATDSAPPTISADAGTTALTKIWSFRGPYNGTTHPVLVNRATLYGGAFQDANINEAENFGPLAAYNVTQGNGSDPSTGRQACPGSKVRFQTDAPKFALIMPMTISTNPNSHEMRVDGLVVPTTFGAPASGANDYAMRYIPVQFGDGTSTYRKLRTIEVMTTALTPSQIGGVVTDPLSFVSPAPQPDALKVCVFGDSITELGTGRYIGDLIGQANTWASGSGGTGWKATSGGGRSAGPQRWTYDVMPHGFDVLFDLNGINDADGVTAAAYAALMMPSYTAAVAAKPETIFVLTGPMSSGTSLNGSANQKAIRDGKKAVAAAFPKNAMFLNNIDDDDPLLSHPWVIGTGKSGSTTGDGNADLVNSSDGVHPTEYGKLYLAQRLAQETARAIPALVAAQ